MSQDYLEFPNTDTLTVSHTKMINNYRSFRSLNAGTSFPATLLYDGTPCWRTDLNQLYIYDGVSSWDLIHPSYVTTDINTSGAEIIDSITTTSEGHISAMGTRTLSASDIGAEPADGTILKDADIGINVQPYDATIVVDADIGINVQPYDATIVVDADIGATVQAYDADTTKNDVANTFTPAQTFSEIIASAKGMSFPATQVPSADANTLDDYEEGTFTPTLYGVTTAGSPAYTTRLGTYTKKGREVTCHIDLQISAKSTIAGNVRISGLPFSNGGVVNAAVFTGLVAGASVTAGTTFNGRVPGVLSDVQLYTFDVAAGNSTLQGTEILDTFRIEATAVYEV